MSESDDQLIEQLEQAIDDSVAAVTQSLGDRAAVATSALENLKNGNYGVNDVMKYAVDMWLISLKDVGRVSKVLSDFGVSGGGNGGS